jgi:hypothetical protein
MNQQNRPSKLRTTSKDFNHGGFNAKPHDFHRLWFEFLLLSPSYHLARRFRAKNGQLSAEDLERLPRDFDQVLAVYDDFGDLQKTFFKPWLRDRGLRLFGIPGDRVSVKLLAKVDDSDDIKANLAPKLVKKYFQSRWVNQSRPRVMLLSIPLEGGKTQTIKEVKAFLEANLVHRAEQSSPKYDLMNKGMHRQNVIDAMAVLYIRAAKPAFKLWQVGVEAKVSPTYSELFDSKTTKRNSANSDDFRILEMMTARKLKLAKSLVENAARGRFPDASDPPHMVDFDPKEFKQIISQRNRWIKQELKKHQ